MPHPAMVLAPELCAVDRPLGNVVKANGYSLGVHEPSSDASGGLGSALRGLPHPS